MTPRPHNSRAPQPFAASRSRSPIHSAQLMAELWRVAGKRACCRGLMSLVFNRTLGPTEPGFPQHECSSILTHLDNNPRCFPGFKMMEIKVDESKSEAQAPSPSPSAIGPPVEVGREPSPVPAPTPAPTIALELTLARVSLVNFGFRYSILMANGMTTPPKQDVYHRDNCIS